MHQRRRSVPDRKTSDDPDRRGNAQRDGREGRQGDEPSPDPAERSPEMGARGRDRGGREGQTDTGEDRRRSRRGQTVEETGTAAYQEGPGRRRQSHREELIPEE